MHCGGFNKSQIRSDNYSLVAQATWWLIESVEIIMHMHELCLLPSKIKNHNKTVKKQKQFHRRANKLLYFFSFCIHCLSVVFNIFRDFFSVIQLECTWRRRKKAHDPTKPVHLESHRRRAAYKVIKLHGTANRSKCFPFRQSIYWIWAIDLLCLVCVFLLSAYWLHHIIFWIPYFCPPISIV